jgi:hypothetical protein
VGRSCFYKAPPPRCHNAFPYPMTQRRHDVVAARPKCAATTGEAGGPFTLGMTAREAHVANDGMAVAPHSGAAVWIS